MNSNFGYTANFWRLYDPIDPDQQLAWLIEELSEAEQRGSYVTLLGELFEKILLEIKCISYESIQDIYRRVICMTLGRIISFASLKDSLI